MIFALEVCDYMKLSDVANILKRVHGYINMMQRIILCSTGYKNSDGTIINLGYVGSPALCPDIHIDD
jgi:hypothetical protein